MRKAKKADARPRVVLVSRAFIIDRKRVLVIRRSPFDRHNGGLWEVPGGKLDMGQDLTHAQEREVLEETGLLVATTHPLVAYDSYTIGDGPYKGMPYVALFSVSRIVGGDFKLSREHTDHRWVTYREMLALRLTAEVRRAAIMLKDHL